MDISDLNTPRTSTPGRNILHDILTESVTTTRTRFTIHSPVDRIPLPMTKCTTKTTIKNRMWNPNFDLTSPNLVQELRQVGDCESRNCITPSPTAILGLHTSLFQSSPYTTSEPFTRTVELKQKTDMDDVIAEDGVVLQSEKKLEDFSHLSELPTEIRNTNFTKGESDGMLHFDLGKVLNSLNDTVVRNYGSNLRDRRFRVVVRLRRRKHLNKHRSFRNKAVPSPSPISKILLNSSEEFVQGASAAQSGEDIFGSNLRALDSPSRCPSTALTKMRKCQHPSIDSPMRKTVLSRYDRRKSSSPRPSSKRRSRDLMKKSHRDIY
ncbi:hypothetical protein FGIG_02433 [Fasciola gigantica]|uniref:Uncharacterized protein n=1 Tax=Fasciola gigantica TaxID=46835 RepID=A0A504Z3L4_FASGI|nr:hypothetical protein FGIG_02433 [Fasciola gigantica]